MPDERLTAAEMSAEERDRTDRWFMEALSGLTGDLMILNLEIEDASLLDVEDLNREKGRLTRLLSMVKRAEEEFVRENGTELRPPTEAMIEETKRLASELGDKIIQEKRASAFVHLVGGLSNFVARALA
jgi:hypothetical protein